MSKTLLLVRHAKSSWDDPFLGDHERPLLKTGIIRTKKIIKFLVERGVKPDLIVSSHALRAFETAKLIAKGCGVPSHGIMIESKLYYQDEHSLYDIVMALPDEKDVVMMVGHNPVMTQFANMFLEEKLHYLPTTGVVSICFSVDRWSDIPIAEKTLHFYVTPKMVK